MTSLSGNNGRSKPFRGLVFSVEYEGKFEVVVNIWLY